MTNHEPLNLPLDFGVPDEVKFATAVEQKDYETLGRLYDQGMPLIDPGFVLQDFLVELEDGLELSDQAIKAFSLRIYKTLALTHLDEDPLTQNAIYQLYRNVMLEQHGVNDSSTRLAAAMAQLPYSKSDHNTLRGTMMEAAVDILDGIDCTPESHRLFAMRLAEVYPGEGATKAFAAYSCNEFFNGDSVTVDTAVGLSGILIHPSVEADSLKDAFNKHLQVNDPGRAALMVLLKSVERLTGSEVITLKLKLEAMQENGFDLSIFSGAVAENDELMILTGKLEFDRALFKPQAMKPHLRDQLLGGDLGL